MHLQVLSSWWICQGSKYAKLTSFTTDSIPFYKVEPFLYYIKFKKKALVFSLTPYYRNNLNLLAYSYYLYFSRRLYFSAHTTFNGTTNRPFRSISFYIFHVATIMHFPTSPHTLCNSNAYCENRKHIFFLCLLLLYITYFSFILQYFKLIYVVSFEYFAWNLNRKNLKDSFKKSLIHFFCFFMFFRAFESESRIKVNPNFDIYIYFKHMYKVLHL